jgi:drug/metabolite transporter (DMT)-like permease
VNWFLFFFASASWGGSFIAIRFMLEGIPPFAAAGLRTLLASLIMAALALHKKAKLPKTRRTYVKMAVVGLANFGVPWACLFWGEQYVQPAVASILNSTSPLFVFLFSYWLLADEPPTWLRFAGVIVGFLGIVFVFGPSISGFSADHRNLYAMFAIALMSVCYGFGSVMMKRIGTTIDIRWNISVQCAVASAFLFTLSALFEKGDWIPGGLAQPKVIWSLLYLVILSTVIGWFIYFRLIRAWGALRASATTYVLPFVALFIDWIWLQKVPTTAELVGGFFIIGSIALIHVARAIEG